MWILYVASSDRSKEDGKSVSNSLLLQAKTIMGCLNFETKKNRPGSGTARQVRPFIADKNFLYACMCACIMHAHTHVLHVQGHVKLICYMCRY